MRTPEEAQRKPKTPFDYVLLCVKALPDVYDIAAVIESVVTPQHTCILLNTTSSLGTESYLEERFPSNVLLSLVCGAELVQIGSSEFELRGESTDLWVGSAIRNPAIPAAIQKDMAEALAMTLKSSNVDCTVSENIQQKQFEKMIGYVLYHARFMARTNIRLDRSLSTLRVSCLNVQTMLNSYKKSAHALRFAASLTN